MDIFFSKNHNNYKTNFKNSILFKNEAGYMFGLTYVFSRIYFLQFQFKKIIFGILVKVWNVRGNPVTVTVTVIVTVTVSFEVPRWNVGPSTYIWTPKKIGGKKVNVKFFTVDPYSVGAGVPRTFIEFGKVQKNIFWKLKRQQ